MRIYIKYEELEKNGDKLAKISNDYQQIITNIKANFDNLSNYWNSENRILYQNRLIKLMNKMETNRKYYELMGKILYDAKDNFLLTEENISKLMQVDNGGTNHDE